MLVDGGSSHTTRCVPANRPNQAGVRTIPAGQRFYCEQPKVTIRASCFLSRWGKKEPSRHTFHSSHKETPTMHLFIILVGCKVTPSPTQSGTAYYVTPPFCQSKVELQSLRHKKKCRFYWACRRRCGRGTMGMHCGRSLLLLILDLWFHWLEITLFFSSPLLSQSLHTFNVLRKGHARSFFFFFFKPVILTCKVVNILLGLINTCSL